MNNKVDFVIAYVNPNDLIWRGIAEEHNVLNNTLGNYENLRFKDDGTINLAVDSIRKFCDFAGNIYLLLFDSEQQLPLHLKDKVIPIWHSEFIPEKYRPCFSSPVIEMFIPFINKLSECFIYLNDDMVFTRTIRREQFFDGNKPKSTIKFVQNINSTQNRIALNSYNTIMGLEQSLDTIKSIHCPTPFNKTQMLECFNRYKSQIIASLYQFGRSENALSQYLYTVYDVVYYNVGKAKINNKFLFSKESYQNFNWDLLSEYDSVCLNSPLNEDITKYIQKLEKYIQNK